MRIVIIEENHKKRINRFVEWFIYMIGYALVLVMMSVLFGTFELSNEYFGLFSLIAAIIIHVLNKTIKPIIVLLTLPITGLTLGLFYPFINVFILFIVQFILGDRFILPSGLFILFIMALMISGMNILMENMIIKPIIERGRLNE